MVTASVAGVITSMWSMLQQVVPKSVEPVLFFLTFLLTLVVVFLVLQQISFFQKSRGIAFIAALVFAYFTASSVFVTVLVSKLFPNIGLAIMAIMGIMLVVVFLSPGSLKEGFAGTPIIVIAVFIITMWLTWTFAAPELERTGALSAISGATGFAINNEDTAVIIVAIVILMVFYFIFKTPNKDTEGRGAFAKWLTGEKW
jgi:hypothetical protein